MGELSPHFSCAEFACHCGCGFTVPNRPLVDLLEKLRIEVGKPIHILSGCRCRMHNRNIGGAKNSQHTLGNAADIKINGMTPDEVAHHASIVMNHGGGIGIYKSFNHVDVRPGPTARWRG